LIPGNQANAGGLQPSKKSLDDTWAGGYLLNATILRSRTNSTFPSSIPSFGIFPGGGDPARGLNVSFFLGGFGIFQQQERPAP
jgi:hypothetical protein